MLSDNIDCVRRNGCQSEEGSALLPAEHAFENAAKVTDARAVDCTGPVNLGSEPEDDQGGERHEHHLGHNFPQRRIVRHAQDQEEGRKYRNP